MTWLELLLILALIVFVIQFIGSLFKFIWNIIVAVVKSTYIPVLAFLALAIIFHLINVLIERFANRSEQKSSAYEGIKKLYIASKNIPRVSDIDLTANYISLAPYESPEDSIFVNHHEQIQSNLDIIRASAIQSEEIKREISNILQECASRSSQIPFEKYLVNRYARKIKFTLFSIPASFCVSARFYRDGQNEEKQKFSWNEVCEYNGRYEEMAVNLKKKKDNYLASEEEKKHREEAQKQQEEERKRQEERQRQAKMREEARQKEEIKRERSKLSASLRYDVLKRDNFRCTICGRSAADGVTLHVDHIKPVSKGGKTEMSNLRTLCDYCNLGKSDKYDPNGMN